MLSELLFSEVSFYCLSLFVAFINAANFRSANFMCPSCMYFFEKSGKAKSAYVCSTPKCTHLICRQCKEKNPAYECPVCKKAGTFANAQPYGREDHLIGPDFMKPEQIDKLQINGTMACSRKINSQGCGAQPMPSDKVILCKKCGIRDGYLEDDSGNKGGAAARIKRDDDDIGCYMNNTFRAFSHALCANCFSDTCNNTDGHFLLKYKKLEEEYLSHLKSLILKSKASSSSGTAPNPRTGTRTDSAIRKDTKPAPGTGLEINVIEPGSSSMHAALCFDKSKASSYLTFEDQIILIKEERSASKNGGKETAVKSKKSTKGEVTESANPKEASEAKNKSIPAEKTYQLGVFNATTSQFHTLLTFKTESKGFRLAREGNKVYIVGIKLDSKLVCMPSGGKKGQGGQQGSSRQIQSDLADYAILVYDLDTRRLKGLANLTTMRAQVATAVYENKLFIAGGHDMTGPTYLNSVEAFDLGNKTWLKESALSCARANAVLIEYKGVLFALGGYCPGGEYSTLIEVFDSATNTWHCYDHMLNGRAGFAATVLNDKIYIAGGWNSSFSTLKTVESWLPEKRSSWKKEKATMIMQRKNLTLATFTGKKGAAEKEPFMMALYGIDYLDEKRNMAKNTVEKYEAGTSSWEIVPVTEE